MVLSRENILIEALPYIREFHKSILVIKVGGKALIDPQTMDDIVQDVVLLRYVGVHPIIVHGGGSEITLKMEQPLHRRLIGCVFICFPIALRP